MQNYKFSFGDACCGPMGTYITVRAGSPEEAIRRVKVMMDNGPIATEFGPGGLNVTIHWNPAAVMRGHIESEFDPEMWEDPPRFVCVENFSHFEVLDTYTGRRAAMGDGVDTLFGPEFKDENGVYHEAPFKPGIPGFVDFWSDSLNEHEFDTLEAYFPEVAEMEKAAEEANEPIRILATDSKGNPMTFERQLAGEYVQLDGLLRYESYSQLVKAKSHWRETD